MTIGGTANLVIRLSAAISIGRGVHAAASILGVAGGPPFESLAFAMQARIIASAIADIAAGTALWLLAPWGVVLWSVVGVLQGVVVAWEGDIFATATQILFMAAVLAAVRASRRAAENDAFRFS